VTDFQTEAAKVSSSKSFHLHSVDQFRRADEPVRQGKHNTEALAIGPIMAMSMSGLNFFVTKPILLPGEKVAQIDLN
jgi:hypothetical protein